MVNTKPADQNSFSFVYIAPKFKSNSEDEYQRHIVLKHPRKPGYPSMAVAG
jgi:hypothetical protein